MIELKEIERVDKTGERYIIYEITTTPITTIMLTIHGGYMVLWRKVDEHQMPVWPP